MPKELILLRGIPGSGKSTLANIIAGSDGDAFAADDYFDLFNNGEFNGALLRDAHDWCKDMVCEMMESDSNKIVVHNTFTREWEMQDYYRLASIYGYRVHSLIVENRHEGTSVHGVPEDKIQQMKDRFEICL